MNTSKRHGWIKSVVLGLLVLGAAGLGGLYLLHVHRAKADTGTNEEESEAAEVLVKTVHPQRDPDFQLQVERPANVEAYYRAPVEARVAGEVEWIEVARGTEVKKGDLLVKVSVPDLDADAVQKCELVKQREQELKLAESFVKTSEANIEEKATLLKSAVATTEFKELQYKRLYNLYLKEAIEKEKVDEANKEREVARANELAAIASKKKADAEWEDAKVKVAVAQANIRVAEAACKAAKALAEYARVRAPWSGTVVDRFVDPGSFVQNASTGHPTPLVTLERTDVVTVGMRVPDNVAPLVSDGTNGREATEAVLELDNLPGVKIKGKVTRIAKTLETRDRDRTMRVEVDLWNSDPKLYDAFLKANYVWDEKEHKYRPRVRNIDTYKDIEKGKYAGKEAPDFLKEGPPPLVPKGEGQKWDPDNPPHLLADMYGKMTLILKSFAKSYLVPSVAIFHEGGRSLMYVVRTQLDKDGKEHKTAHKVAVRVQVDDGDLAKVILVDKKGADLGELTGKEEVVISNQEELSEDQPVATALQEDWHALKRNH